MPFNCPLQLIMLTGTAILWTFCKTQKLSSELGHYLIAMHRQQMPHYFWTLLSLSCNRKSTVMVNYLVHDHIKLGNLQLKQSLCYFLSLATQKIILDIFTN